MWFAKRWSANARTDEDFAIASVTKTFDTQGEALEGVLNMIREEIAGLENPKWGERNEFCIARLYALLWLLQNDTQALECQRAEFGGLAFGVYGRD
jgi:hypothetical protein